MVNESRTEQLESPSTSVLLRLPVRALVFLRAVATRAPIWELLQEGGFGLEDHAEGWALLAAVSTPRHAPSTCASHVRAENAERELHAWTRAHFGRFRAALARLHPAWVHLFPAIDPHVPRESVLAVAKLLSQLNAGEASRDSGLVSTLGRRGLGSVELEHLGRLLTDAQSLSDEACPQPEVEDRTAELTALYHWYRDWAETARHLIKRKDYLVFLGLAERGAG